MNKTAAALVSEPYRFFFPLGILFLFCGALVWLPLIWDSGEYPVLAHRYLMLNGFTGSFIGGFLMTALPKFSQTRPANVGEVCLYLVVTLLGLYFASAEQETFVFIASALQPICILLFLFPRIAKRRANPPYSFIFIFVGLFLWIFSAVASAFIDPEAYKQLHYQGSIAAIILGVGSRLVPGILGHVEIVNLQKQMYEKPGPLLKTVPLGFILLILSFVVSYFLPATPGGLLRAAVVSVVAMVYWRLWQAPRDRTALTWNIWGAGWLILLSFLASAFLSDGGIHVGHSFFITGIVLLSLLIATRVLQSHGPKDKELENRKMLYLISSLLLLSALTRVSAYFMPDHYLRHLGYAASILCLAVGIWSWCYLRFCLTVRS